MSVEVVQPPLPLESVQNTLGLLLSAVIVIAFTIIILVRREDLRNRFISLAGQERLGAMTHALDEAGDRVGRYLRLQLLVNTAYGALIGTGLHFIGIPGGLLWGHHACPAFIGYFRRVESSVDNNCPVRSDRTDGLESSRADIVWSTNRNLIDRDSHSRILLDSLVGAGGPCSLNTAYGVSGRYGLAVS